MLVYLTLKAVEWAQINRFDVNCDPCDDCTHWCGLM
jgi:hypothetical protein